LVVAALVLGVLAGAAPSASAARPRWIHQVAAIANGHPMSIVVGDNGETWFARSPDVRRPPASNEKLVLSMALFHHFGTGHTFRVQALALGVSSGEIAGDLYLRGEGDPETADGRLDNLAAAIWGAGVRRIDGGVIGVTGPFRRDWFAPGWKSYFPRVYIPRPTALTFRGNVDATGRHIEDPEVRAARYLTAALRDRGIVVAGAPSAGPGIGGLDPVATVRSWPLRSLVQHMDRRSINFSAEVLGKALARDLGGVGSIAGAGGALCAFEAAHGVGGMTCHDASGLSYGNRQTARGLLRLLWWANRQPWAPTLRTALPDGGQGTLKDRLAHVELHAKTGTLIGASALSGWVWSDAARRWIEFSILTSGMNEYAAKDLEDRVVRVLASSAKDPTP
jgi:D-alanyl-D-alanine carboxypeptidase/D-alanyl-D-alanine-endopeptidase (penicillin-binding protein 4)